MRRKVKEASYDTRFKHKLNMLEPGCRMLLAAAILAGAGLTCSLFSWALGMQLFLASAAAVVLVLLLLVAIELRQDRILNKIALEERRNQPDEGN